MAAADQIVFLSSDGSGAGVGTPDDPYLTIEEALAGTSPGCTFILAKGNIAYCTTSDNFTVANRRIEGRGGVLYQDFPNYYIQIRDCVLENVMSFTDGADHSIILDDRTRIIRCNILAPTITLQMSYAHVVDSYFYAGTIAQAGTFEYSMIARNNIHSNNSSADFNNNDNTVAAVVDNHFPGGVVLKCAGGAIDNNRSYGGIAVSGGAPHTFLGNYGTSAHSGQPAASKNNEQWAKAGTTNDDLDDLPASIRDVDNTTPAAGSLGAAINSIGISINGLSTMADTRFNTIDADHLTIRANLLTLLNGVTVNGISGSATGMAARLTDIDAAISNFVSGENENLRRIMDKIAPGSVGEIK